MKKLSKAVRAKLIKVYKERILEMKNQQDKLFSKACVQLSIPESSEPNSTILFDVLYNNYLTPKQAVERLWPVRTAAVWQQP